MCCRVFASFLLFCVFAFASSAQSLSLIPTQSQALSLIPTQSQAQSQTLRVDYIFSGTDKASEISLDEMSRFDGWAGRRHNLKDVPVRGNGQLLMTDAQTGDTLYRHSFSTLFQEWQATEEATKVRKSFENVFLLPMPESKAQIKVEIYDFYGNVCASLRHEADPDDILIRSLNPRPAPHKWLLQSGKPEEKIDVAIVAEGYTQQEADKFYADAQTAMEAILGHEPFGAYRDRFNFVAVALPSQDSGVSVPGESDWKETALKAHFNTFYMDRYLTTLRLKNLHDKLCGIPYEHIVILANTDTYGGGGIYNSYTLTTAGHTAFRPVVVHEFGHSFAGLADEYYYDDMYAQYYYPHTEPWEQNITTLKDFDSKWKDMMGETPVQDGSDDSKAGNGVGQAGSDEAGARSDDTRTGNGEVRTGTGVGLYEGAGYQSKGVWRPAEDCRMHTNKADSFCPVCQRAIGRIIEFYTE